MIAKIAWYSTKGKLKDYLILFSGLMMASGIFYMFQSLARNKSLLGDNSHSSSFAIIFQMGSVLLGMITFFYLLYANSFLMNMKRKDYGMLMMLGASKSKIILLNFLETIGICLLTTFVGSLLGGCFSYFVNILLKQSLGGDVPTKILNGQAFLATLIFFIGVFLLTALLNGKNLAKEQLISLLKKQALPDQKDTKNWILMVRFLLGLGILAFSYYAMYQVASWRMNSIIIAVFTSFFGTYLLVYSAVMLVLNLIRQRKGIYLNKMNSILIAQLKYRITGYAQILTVISILFALALGALTVGISFKNEGYKIADRALFYDLVIAGDKRQAVESVGKKNIKLLVEYDLKIDNHRILIDRDSLEKLAFTINGQVSTDGKVARKNFKASAIEKSPSAQEAFKRLLPEKWREKELVFENGQAFKQANEKSQSLILIKTNDFQKNYKALVSIIKQMGSQKQSDSFIQSNQKVEIYQGYAKGLIPFEYMGFFLGIAFLTMLTSCLMFKILTGYKLDQARYQILAKIGASQKGIKSTIKKELLVVFSIPAFLGSLHVLFGLQLFKVILTNPYDSVVISLLAFTVIYLAYFYLTLKIYLRIIFAKIS